MLRLTLDPRPVRVTFVVDKEALEVSGSSVSIAPSLLRARVSCTATIMQSWELAALLNDDLTSRKGG